MKKVLIAMAVLFGLVAGAMTFSSFALPRQEVKEDCSQVNLGVPKRIVLYEGLAFYRGEQEVYPKRIKVNVHTWEGAKANIKMADVWMVYDGNTYSWVGYGYEVNEYHSDYDGSTYYGVMYNGNEYFTWMGNYHTK